MPPPLWIRESARQPLYSPFKSEYVAVGAQAVNRSSVASLAFLVWDILITTDDEIKYIWPRAWSFTKCAYFIVRYIPMLIQISLLLVGSELTPYFHFTPHDCSIWGAYQAVGAGAVVVIVDIILILRVDALYHGDRIIRRFLAVAYAMEITGIIVALTLTAPGIKYDTLCVVTAMPETLIIYASSTIIFQLFLFCLTLYKFSQAAKHGWGDVPLAVLLTRDGTWAFFLLVLMYVVQLSFFGLHNGAFAGVLYGWLMTAFSFCGYRILFNLAHFAERTQGKPVNATANNRPTNAENRVSEIRFSMR